MMNIEMISHWITPEEQKAGFLYLQCQHDTAIFGSYILIATKERAIVLEKGISSGMGEVSDKHWNQLISIRFQLGSWFSYSKLTLKFFRYPCHNPIPNNPKVRWDLLIPKKTNTIEMIHFLQRQETDARACRAEMESQYLMMRPRLGALRAKHAGLPYDSETEHLKR